MPIVAAVLALAGCGGQPNEPKVAARQGLARPHPIREHPRHRAHRARRAQASPAPRRARMTRYADSIGAAKRAQAVRLATASYLRAHQLVDATFRVSRDGYSVDIAIPGTDLCTAIGRIAAEPRFATELREALGFLRGVTIHATGRTGSLRDYLARHCRRPTRVYERSGSGSFTTPTLTMPRGRWAVLLAGGQDGAQVEVVATATARTVAGLTLSGPGVTSRTLATAGRVRLRVHGRGKWTVAVLRPGV